VKIVYLYGSDPLDLTRIDETWGTAEGLAYQWRTMGHSVQEINFNSVNLYEILRRSLQEGPAVVVLTQAGTIPEQLQRVWHKQNFKSCLMVAEGADEPQIMRYNLGHTLPADIVWSSDIESVRWYAENGKKSFWVPHWGDEIVYTYSKDPCNGVIATAAGPRGGLWKESTLALKSEFGDNFYAPRLNGEAYLSPSENNRMYQMSSISFTVSTSGDITRRLFEAAIAGRMTICDRLSTNKQLKDIFVEGEDIECFSSMQELITKARHYLKDHDHRIKIAENARKKCLQSHTASKRAQQLIDIFESCIGVT